MFLVSVVPCQVLVSATGRKLILPSVVILSVISKSRQWGDLGPLGLSSYGKKKNNNNDDTGVHSPVNVNIVWKTSEHKVTQPELVSKADNLNTRMRDLTFSQQRQRRFSYYITSCLQINSHWGFGRAWGLHLQDLAFQHHFPELLELEGEGITLLQNVRNYLQVDTK